MFYSMLENDGRCSYQTDWNTVEEAIKYYKEECTTKWAVIVEIKSGNVVHLFNSTQQPLSSSLRSPKLLS